MTKKWILTIIHCKPLTETGTNVEVLKTEHKVILRQKVDAAYSKLMNNEIIGFFVGVD